MSRHEKPPVKLAHLLLCATNPALEVIDFDTLSPDSKVFFEQMARVTERRYDIGSDIGYLNEIGVFFLIVLAALFVTLLFTHWQSAVFLMVGAALGFLLSAVAFYWAERRPFTMDDLP